MARRLTEEQRVAIRNVRRDANDQVKALQKGSKITEDERADTLEEVQKLTDTYIGKVDELLKVKEDEILTV